MNIGDPGDTISPGLTARSATTPANGALMMVLRSIFSADDNRALASANCACAPRLARSALSTSRSAMAPAATKVLARCHSRVACSAAIVACATAERADSAASRTEASSMRPSTVPSFTRSPCSTMVASTAPLISARRRASRSALSVPEMAGPLRSVSIRATAIFSGPMFWAVSAPLAAGAAVSLLHAVPTTVAARRTRNADRRVMFVIE